MSIENLKQLLAADMAAVDQVIRTRLRSEVLLVNQVGEYIINSGGKRLRPALVVLSAEAFGYRYSRAFQMMVEVGEMRVMQTLADATNTIAEGEVLQLLNCHDADVDAANYMHVIHCKTAKLFEAAMRLGAILGSATAANEEAAARYGMHLGTAFQLLDDVLDYSADEQQTGKHLGDDLAEGKPTLPLIYAMQHGTPEQAAVVRGAIEQGDVGKFAEVLQIIHDTGALDFTRQQALREAELACAAIVSLAGSKYKQCLLELAHFAATRQF